jgi:hypothetical protein
MRAECVDTRSSAMSIISVDTLCSLLGFALERMKHQGVSTCIYLGLFTFYFDCVSGILY